MKLVLGFLCLAAAAVAEQPLLRVKLPDANTQGSNKISDKNAIEISNQVVDPNTVPAAPSYDINDTYLEGEDDAGRLDLNKKTTKKKKKTTTTSPTTTISPNITTISPNVTTISPNVTTISPNVTTISPNVTTISPNVTTISPNVTTISPNVTTISPNTTTITPNSTTTSKPSSAEAFSDLRVISLLFSVAVALLLRSL